MSKRVLKRSMFGGVGIGTALLAGLVLYTAAAPPNLPGGGHIRGDLNLDGVVNLADVRPFVQALHDPEAWLTEHGLPMADLLAVADFTHDKKLTTADVPGFCAAVRAGEGVGGLGGNGPIQPPRGTLDLDIDSDNNNGTGYPDRSINEDNLEDAAGQPGKLVRVNDDDDNGNGQADKDESGAVAGEDDLVPLVLQPAPATLPINYCETLRYRLAYPTSVLVWKSAQRGDPSAKVPSAQVQTDVAWIHGDMNGDGILNFNDIDPFIYALSNFEQWKQQVLSGCPAMLLRAADIGDFNNDRQFNFDDIDPFVAALQANEQKYVPVYLWVEGLDVSLATGDTHITAEADTNRDGVINGNDATPDTVATTVYTPDTGAPPAWGAGLAVSPFSTVNLRSGNLLTALPLVSFDPVGPPVSFTLYHNSSVSAYGTDTHGWGFDLGTGWSVSYAGGVKGTWGDARVTMVGDDGSQTVYAYNTDHYDPPPGVYDKLDWNAVTQEWTLTSPNQWKAIFKVEPGLSGYGLLTEIHDSAGNVLTVGRDTQANNYRILYIASAADKPPDFFHRLTFNYNTNNKLGSIQDPLTPARVWTFDYETGGSERLIKVHYPEGGGVGPSFVQIVYESPNSGRIKDVTSRDLKTWTYTYAAGKLQRVQDPSHEVSPGQFIRYEQSFGFNPVAAYDQTEQLQLWTTTYTDRRHYDWLVKFDAAGNARRVTDPLSNTSKDAYDASHNCTSYTDELGHTWTATYGPVGNVLTVSSPLTGGDAQTWTLTWVPANQQQYPNLYRLTRITDPAGHWVQYGYGPDPYVDPTVVTSVTEQQALPGDPYGDTTTTLEYYGAGPGDVHARGQLKWVVDANQVHHFFEYDPWGYPKQTTEGLLEGGRSVWINPVITGPFTNDGAGQTYIVSIQNQCFGTTTLDSNGRPVLCLVTCPYRDGRPFVRQGLVPSPEVSPFMECFGTAQYDVVGRFQHVDRCGATADAGSFRSHDVQYDDLGRPTRYAIQTGVNGQPGWQFDRIFLSQGYDAEGALVSLQGPDGQTTQHLFNGQPGYDELGRPRTVSRSGMSATFSYDAASRVTQVDYGNGAKILRHYDEADRLQWLEHRGASNNLLLRIDYAWNTDNTVRTRTEQNVVTGQTAVVTFAYDRRDRLTAETRVVNGTTTVYDITYTYDPLGNRLQKLDAAGAGRKTDYYYDSVEQNRDPNWRTNDNRLLWYVESAGNGQGGWTMLRTVRYTYYETGHVSNITIKDEWTGGGTPPTEYNYYHDLALYYTSGGKLWRVLWDQWLLNGTDERLAAREFYYDGPRQRYLARDVDPNSWEAVGTQHWTDYAGGLGVSPDSTLPYGDFDQQFSQYPSFTLTEQMRYLSEFGPQAQQIPGRADTSYFHGDLVRSTMLTTDESGSAAAAVSYTAFGEPIGDPDALGTRYQYAGGRGCESGLLALSGANANLAPITLMHVGERWYQAAVGRFVQRDPRGLHGGMNMYACCAGDPLSMIDPDDAADPFERINRWIEELINGKPLGATGAGITAAGAANFKWRLGIGRLVNRSGIVVAGVWGGWNLGKLLDYWLGISSHLAPCLTPWAGPSSGPGMPDLPEPPPEFKPPGRLILP